MKDIHLCYINIGTFWIPFPPLPVSMPHKELIKGGTGNGDFSFNLHEIFEPLLTPYISNYCFKGKEELCGWEQRNMKGVVAFL